MPGLVSMSELVQLNAIPKLVEVLRFACENRVESFWELLLEIAISIVARVDINFLESNPESWAQMWALVRLSDEVAGLGEFVGMRVLVERTMKSLAQLGELLSYAGAHSSSQSA